MENIINMLRKTLENYEDFRYEYINGNQEPLISLRDSLKEGFKNLLKQNKILRINVYTNNGKYNNPPKLENFNIAFLENKHSISKGIYSGIDFNDNEESLRVYISTSYTNKPNRQEWENIFLSLYEELNKYFHWEIPLKDKEHNWRFFSKKFTLVSINDEDFANILDPIQVGIFYTRLIINKNLKLVEKYLNVEGLLKFETEDIKERINILIKKEINKDKNNLKIL